MQSGKASKNGYKMTQFTRILLAKWKVSYAVVSLLERLCLSCAWLRNRIHGEWQHLVEYVARSFMKILVCSQKWLGLTGRRSDLKRCNTPTLMCCFPSGVGTSGGKWPTSSHLELKTDSFLLMAVCPLCSISF